jgi:hypothetical protein
VVFDVVLLLAVLLVAACGSLWQLVAVVADGGKRWQLLASVGSLWRVVGGFGRSRQHIRVRFRRVQRVFM